MNRIARAFDGKKAFIPFITGGDPDLETTGRLIPAMAEAGADIIEIGIPFSDPVAEGPVIQDASRRALEAGCNLHKLLSVVRTAREKTDVPLLFMTYLNPILTFGAEKFIKSCKDAGIDGLIVPDMPFEEKGELSGYCRASDVSLISMIAPTSEERVAAIAREAEGFLYCVSSMGVTGVRGELGAEAGRMVARAKNVSSVPCAVGFGVSTPAQAKELCRFADGVIVGSAIVKLVAEHGRECVQPVADYVRSMKAGMA